MKAENYDEALKKIGTLRAALTSVPDAKPIEPASSPEGKVDKADLISKAAIVEKAITDAAQDDAAFVQSALKLRKFRKMLKSALADNPSPTELAKLAEMKKKLDTLFLNDVKKQCHGPQRHEGDVTPKQLTDRSTKGFDPMSGATTDAVSGLDHMFNRHASRFLSEGDYVDAEETVRGSKAFVDERPKVMASGEERLVLKLPIASVLGADYAKKIEGVTRNGSVKTLIGSHATDFTNGTIIAVYVLTGGDTYKLLTLYPEPNHAVEVLYQEPEAPHGICEIRNS